MRSIGFLAHNQSAFERPKTFVSKEDADHLLRQMVAEKLSSKLIRAFAPDSKFRLMPATVVKSQTAKISILGEIPGVRFQLRPSRAGRYVAELHHLALKSFRHQLSA